MILDYTKTCMDHHMSEELYPKACNRAAWNKLPDNLKKDAVASGEKYLGYTYPQITAQDYMRFSKDGNRSEFEKKYFDRREALNQLVVAECVEGKGRFLPDIINGVFLLCEESGWNLPPHNGYCRDRGLLPLPDRTRPIIELFACETGAQLAVTRYLLWEQFDSIDPSISERIDTELYERIFVPFFTVHYWWMGNKDEPMCNWTSWCIQNVLITAVYSGMFASEAEFSQFHRTPVHDELFAFTHDRRIWIQQLILHTKPALIDLYTEDHVPFYSKVQTADWQSNLKVLQKLLLLQCSYSLDCFLKDYGEDGCCEEGALYYGHAGLCLFQALNLMNVASNHYYDTLMLQPKIRNIASYILNVHVSGNQYINYADCSPVLSKCGAREYLFGKMTKQPELMTFAAKSYFEPQDKLEIISNDINLFYDVQQLFTYQEMLQWNNQGNSIRHSDCYYKSNGLFIVHDKTMTLAVKAGGNNDSHNHNDTGSLTLYKNGSPYLIDLGVETYSGKTFSSERYEIWTMQSAWHNLPTINGYMQLNGSSYHSTNVETCLEGESPYIQMELQNCYPIEAGIRRYVRNVTMNRDQNIILRDTWDESVHDGYLSLLTYECPRWEHSHLKIGTLGTIQISDHGEIIIEEVPIKDPRLAIAWKHSVYRIKIPICGDEIRLEIR